MECLITTHTKMQKNVQQCTCAGASHRCSKPSLKLMFCCSKMFTHNPIRSWNSNKKLLRKPQISHKWDDWSFHKVPHKRKKTWQEMLYSVVWTGLLGSLSMSSPKLSTVQWNMLKSCRKTCYLQQSIANSNTDPIFSAYEAMRFLFLYINYLLLILLIDIVYGWHNSHKRILILLYLYKAFEYTGWHADTNRNLYDDILS